jgi:hypothetical protein
LDLLLEISSGDDLQVGASDFRGGLHITMQVISTFKSRLNPHDFDLSQNLSIENNRNLKLQGLRVAVTYDRGEPAVGYR